MSPCSQYLVLLWGKADIERSRHSWCNLATVILQTNHLEIVRVLQIQPHFPWNLKTKKNLRESHTNTSAICPLRCLTAKLILSILFYSRSCLQHQLISCLSHSHTPYRCWRVVTVGCRSVLECSSGRPALMGTVGKVAGLYPPGKTNRDTHKQDENKSKKIELHSYNNYIVVILADGWFCCLIQEPVEPVTLSSTSIPATDIRIIVNLGISSSCSLVIFNGFSWKCFKKK